MIMSRSVWCGKKKKELVLFVVVRTKVCVVVCWDGTRCIGW